jgi:hypothetical protein
MVFTDLPAQYMFLFYLTVVLLMVKGLILIVILKRILTERKKLEKVPLVFLYAMFVLMLSLFTSRVFYGAFDFFATGFDMDLYTLPFNIVLHKTGQVIVNVSIAFLIWALDRRIMLNKFKGIPAIIILAGALIQAFFPIREGFVEDFELYSFFNIFFLLPAVIIFINFMWMGIVTPRLRKTSWVLAIAFMIHTFAAVIVNAAVISSIENALGPWVPYVMYTISITAKVVGLFLMLYGALNYMQLNIAMVDYYQAKRLCVVHKGGIKGRVFMCGNCRIFYCIDCKNAIVKTENKCWNCGDVLEKSLVINLSITTDDPLYQHFLKLKGELKQEKDADTIALLMRIGSDLMALDASGALPANIKQLIEHRITTARSRDGVTTDDFGIAVTNAVAGDPKKGVPGEKQQDQV